MVGAFILEFSGRAAEEEEASENNMSNVKAIGEWGECGKPLFSPTFFPRERKALDFLLPLLRSRDYAGTFVRCLIFDSEKPRGWRKIEREIEKKDRMRGLHGIVPPID